MRRIGEPPARVPLRKTSHWDVLRPSCAFKKQNFVLYGGRRGLCPSTLPPFEKGGRKLFVHYFLQSGFFDKLEPGNTILMCSDGLSNMVEDSEIEKIILNQTEELPQKGERLLREANQNGGKDNIAVILVEPFTNEVEKC